MESLAFLAFFVPLAGIGVVVLFIIAVIQQSKHEQTGGFKQAFFTVVSLVMLSISIGASVALLSLMAKEYVFTQAVSESERYNTPPTLYLQTTAKAGTAAALTCVEDCELTADDRAQFQSWKENYRSWKNTPFQTAEDFRRNLVGPLSFLIIGLPLYLVFLKLMERGARQELQQLKKPTPLRSLYFYFVAFSGLIMAVFAAGSLVNTGLKSWLGTENTNQASVPRPLGVEDQGHGPQSIINCADACGFSDADVALVKDWQTDNERYQTNIEKPSGQLQNDLAVNIPLFLVGLPLFWYHFSRIRKEGTGDKPTSPPTSSPAIS